MKIRTKILLVVATTAVVIAGLFVLKAYYGNKLGIFADLLTDEKIIASKTVAEGGFVDDQISNMEKPEGADYYQIAGSDSEICGNYPDQTSADSMSGDLDFNLSLTKVTDNDDDAGIQNFNDNYYIGNQQITQVDGGDFPLKPEGDDPSIDDPGFSITRGPGWLNVELDKSSIGSGVNAVQGSITLPVGTSLNANSISYSSGGSGIENGNNGSHDLTSNNDEITIFADQRKIDFVLVTTTNTDIFVINYCFSPVSTYEGTISGQIDIGEVQPIASLRLDTIDYSSPRDQVLITTEISQNGSDWFAGNERSGLRYNFQGSEPRDSYCFRYIKYQIKFKTESSDPSESVKLRGINIYGGDTCGTELPFDPGSVSNLGTACSNGLDDDGDGKIDYSINEGVASKNGDPGCTNLMDDSEKIDGSVHVNYNGLYNEGEITGDASSTETTYNGWFGVQPGVAGPGIFGGAKVYPVPAADFNQVDINISETRIAVRDFGEGQYIGTSSRNRGYHIVLKADEFDLYEVRSYEGRNPTRWDIEAETFIDTYDYPESGVVFVEDNLWIEGTIDNQKLSFFAADPDESSQSKQKRILITDDILYSHYDGTDKIGLVTQTDILVTQDAPTDLEINAAMIARYGEIMIEQYNQIKDHIKVYGSMAHNTGIVWTYASGSTIISGYRETELLIDESNVLNPPPMFPTTGSYAVLSWREE